MPISPRTTPRVRDLPSLPHHTAGEGLTCLEAGQGAGEEEPEIPAAPLRFNALDVVSDPVQNEWNCLSASVRLNLHLSCLLGYV